ncbi:MAG: histidine kinase dimerization/phospho-acceptor domain-containing protein [Gemmataceae bacterium]
MSFPAWRRRSSPWAWPPGWLGTCCWPRAGRRAARGCGRRWWSALEQKGQAEAARAAQDGFLAALNHEIRTPLNGVLGMVQVLAQGGLPAEQAGQVAALKESAEHLAGLLERLLEGREPDDDPAAPAGSQSALLLSADEDDRHRLGGMLVDAGCSVVAVADGQAGMTELVRGVVEGSPFTLIVLTDDLPPALAERWLRQVEQSPARCPVIVLPRKSNMGELRAALGQG